MSAEKSLEVEAAPGSCRMACDQSLGPTEMYPVAEGDAGREDSKPAAERKGLWADTGTLGTDSGFGSLAAADCADPPMGCRCWKSSLQFVDA